MPKSEAKREDIDETDGKLTKADWKFVDIEPLDPGRVRLVLTRPARATVSPGRGQLPRPVVVRRLAARFESSMQPENPHQPAAAARRRLLVWALALAAMTVASVAWTTPPARALLDPQALLALLAAFNGHPAAPWVVLAGFLVGGLLVLPVTFMVVVAVATFGATEGFLYALGGATLSGTLSFAIGRRLGHRQVERLAGSRLHAVSRRLGDAGITAIAAVRMVPVTHFTVVSLVAGASHIRARDFVAGTVLGVAQGSAPSRSSSTGSRRPPASPASSTSAGWRSSPPLSSPRCSRSVTSCAALTPGPARNPASTHGHGHAQRRLGRRLQAARHARRRPAPVHARLRRRAPAPGRARGRAGRRSAPS
ncbi:MAG: VTT domain-containing protein [Halofilum sp. (in: g-proteobacteria)]|nr:VTT domain-containing protein [Halofilum sp. (in: g-proteobacteria)]